MRALFPALVLSAVCSIAVSAEPLKIRSAQPEPNQPLLIIVTLDRPAPAATVLGLYYWEILLRTKDRIYHPTLDRVAIATCSNTVYAVSSLVSRCPAGEDVIEIALQMTNRAPPGAKHIDVWYVGPAGTAAADFDLIEKTGTTLFEGSKADDADISIDGKYTKLAQSHATYDLDLSAGYMRAVFLTPKTGATTKASPVYLGRLGFYGQAKTEGATNLSPDSFLLYGVYQRELGSGGFSGPFQSPWLSLRFPGWEMDGRGKQRNFILSPVVTIPIRLTATPLGLLEPGLTVPHMTLLTGVEVVKPEKTELGTRTWRARWLAGVTLSTGYAPEMPWLHSIKLTGSYVVRLLTTAEVFKDPRHAPLDPDTGERGKPILELGKQERHHLQAELTYNFAKWAGLAFKYEYGSEPPVFVVTDHKFTIGLKMTLSQTSFARYAILKP